MSASAAEAIMDRTAMSPDEFRQLLLETPAAEIRTIPLEQVPNNLPRGFTQGLPERLRQPTEDLLFDASAAQLAQRAELRERIGPEVQDALDLADAYARGDAFAYLRQQVAEIARMHKERDEADSIEMGLLRQHITSTTDLAEQIQRESRVVFEARDRLIAHVEHSGGRDEAARSALEVLNAQARQLDAVLSQFFYVRVVIAASEMARLKERIDEMDHKFLSIQQQIDASLTQVKQLEEQISNPKNKKLAGTYRARMDHLNTKITALKGEQSLFEAIVSESSLLEWMDTFVNASISPSLNAKVTRFSQKVEHMMLDLLENYCARQEAAARRIARHPGMHANPAEMIQFLLRSEQFILNYFSEKRIKITDWLGSAAQQRLATLDGLEKNLLSELKHKKQGAKARLANGPNKT